MIRRKPSPYDTVGTVKKSKATTSFIWVLRNVFHVGEGAFRKHGLYFSTGDWATSMPSFRSSPTMRGGPQVGFACHIVRMRSRTSP
jgi:hypothetical protein